MDCIILTHADEINMDEKSSVSFFMQMTKCKC